MTASVRKKTMQDRIQRKANAAECESRLVFIDKRIAAQRKILDDENQAKWIRKQAKVELESLILDRQKVMDTPAGDKLSGEITSPAGHYTSMTVGLAVVIGLLWGVTCCFSNLGASNAKWGVDRCNDFIARRAAGENIVLNSADRKMCNRAFGLTPKVYQ